MSKTLILLENEDQAREYLDRISDFPDALPITFSFSAEKTLSKAGIKFKMEEDYENEKTYKGIHLESRDIVEKIFKIFQLEYRGVELFSLFYSKLYFSIAEMKKYFRILKEIVKKEKPETVIVFESNEGDDIVSNIIKNLQEVRIEKYTAGKKKDVRNKLIFKAAGVIQKAFAITNLFLAGKKDIKIFMSGGRTYFESITKQLLEDNKNKIFNFDDCLRKSYSIGKRYLPFYEFSGKRDARRERELKEKINHIKVKIEYLDLSKKLSLEREIVNPAVRLLKNIMERDFIRISRKINELRSLFEKGKVNMILLSDDDDAFSKTVARVAREFDIPSLVFLHGIPCGNIVFGPIEGDYFIVFGERAAEWCIKNKTQDQIGAQKVKIIGCPRYDILKPIESGKKIIVYTMEVASGDQLVPETHLTKKRQKEVLRGIYRAMKKFPDYKLIIKTRPGWDMADLPKRIAEEENFDNVEFVERADNAKLLGDAEIVIINRTTMGIEALLLNKPVISVYFKDLRRFSSYDGMNIVKKVFNQEQLENAINSLLKQKKHNILKDKQLEKYVIKDKKSTQRTVEFINSLLYNRVNKPTDAK